MKHDPRIALAISGFPRHYEKTFESVRKWIIEPYRTKTYPAIYEPFAEREYERTVWPYNCRSYFRKQFIDEFYECFQPIGVPDVQCFMDELPRIITESSGLPKHTARDYANRAMWSRWERIRRTGELIREGIPHERYGGYDLVFHWRTDLYIYEMDLDFSAVCNSNKLYVPSENGQGFSVGLHGEFHKDGGIVDVMWVCKPEIHYAICTLLDHIKSYVSSGVMCFQEVIFGHHLRRLGIEVEVFPAKITFPDLFHQPFPYEER